MHPDQRVYNMILCKKSFGQTKDVTYALLGYENGKTWNLLGGKKDDVDKKTMSIKRLNALQQENFMKKVVSFLTRETILLIGIT